MKNICIFLTLSICNVGFAQTKGKIGREFKNRFRLGIEAGVYFDQSTQNNDYLVRPNYTMHFDPYILVTKKQFLGLHIGAQVSNLKVEDIQTAFYEGAEHSKLKEMTYGYDNIYQLGASYRYIQIFKNGFTLTPTFKSGALWILKEHHYLDYYPDANDPSIKKRFGTYPSDDKNNIGLYFSGGLNLGYHWEKTNFTLFGGFNYLTGEVEQKNLYVEEWMNSGTYTITPYFETRRIRMFTVEVGVILNFNRI